MSDLIKRSDAIKAIEELPNAYNGWSDAYDKAYIIGTLEEVPKADRPQKVIAQVTFDEEKLREIVKEAVERFKEEYEIVDRPQDDDWEKYSDKLWKNAYERGKADGAMIYGNEHNCIMTIFGECSYAETGCGDCAVVEKVRKALSTDRPQGEWEIVGKNHPYKRCPFCKRVRAFTDTRFCDWCGARMKGADDD